jgi:hypothetical protein
MAFHSLTFATLHQSEKVSIGGGSPPGQHLERFDRSQSRAFDVDRLGSGSVLLPACTIRSTRVYQSPPIPTTSLCADTDPVLIIIAMDLATVLAFIGQSLLRGWFL